VRHGRRLFRHGAPFKQPSMARPNQRISAPWKVNASNRWKVLVVTATSDTVPDGADRRAPTPLVSKLSDQQSLADVARRVSGGRKSAASLSAASGQ
jgi:hypothetical protein